MLGNSEQVRSQIAEAHGGVHGDAVIQNMQVTLPKVHNPLPVRRLDISISNVPLFRDGPVEDRRARRHLNRLQRNPVCDQSQCPPDAIAGDASADGVKFSRETVQIAPGIRRVSLFEFLQQAHCVYSKFGYVRSRSEITFTSAGQII